MKKILLVDDCHLTRVFVADFLQNHGYEVETASESEEAVEKACYTFLPDLILMDIELKGNVDGIETAKKILKLRDIPIVFLTANTSLEIINKIKDVKGYGYIVKGPNKEAIISTIEMALRLHEANSIANMFEYIFENSSNEIYVFNLETLEFIKVNKAARQNLGYTNEELRFMTPLHIKPQFNEQSFRELLTPLIGGEKTNIVFRTVHRRKNNSTYPVEVQLQLFQYKGKSLGFASIIDLTNQNKIEEKLKEKELLLKAITDSAYDAIIVLDGDGKVIFWSPSAERIFGYSEKEIINKELHPLLATNIYSVTLSKDMLARFKETGELDKIPNPIELKARHKNGYEVDIELTLSALKLKDKWYAVGIVRDISERKKSQDEITKTWKLYSELAENAPIGIIRCDKNGNIIYLNNKVLEILGFLSEEETKKINLFTFPLLVKYGFSEKLKKCIENNKTETFETNYISKLGKEVWARVHIKPHIEEEKVSGALIILDDITEKKKLEEELRLLSYTDALTGAYNRRYLVQKLEEEIERAKRYGNEFSLILLDIDHFKKVNDCYGHNVGDMVLKSVVKMIKERIRKVDTLARWGGEEFIIMLPNTPVEKAVILAEELREILSKMTIPGIEKVTASFGVTGYRPGDTVDSLVKRADDLMYTAKAEGRNCVCYLNGDN